MTSTTPTTATSPLILALPSKGRLMEQCADLLARGGIEIIKSGSPRGYRGTICGIDGVEVVYIASTEIAQHIRTGEVHLGVTGEDLIRETIPDADARMDLVLPLGFGRADVVVAVPQFWIDVDTMADLEEAAVLFRRRHGRRMRVATKYMGLTRGFFAGRRFDGGTGRGHSAVTSYLIVESLGATEGAPASGTAELIVDITTTGSTLRANGLKILSDGVILRSEANLVASKGATWTARAGRARDLIVARMKAALPRG